MPKELIGNFKFGRDNIQNQDETDIATQDQNNLDAN
jgi:hypothetical protein